MNKNRYHLRLGLKITLVLVTAFFLSAGFFIIAIRAVLNRFPEGDTPGWALWLISAVAIALFFTILLPFLFSILKRISTLNSEMELLAGGELNHPVSIKGEDELGLLSRSIEEMRRSVLSQLEAENEAILANKKLITSVSHDFRTPLTRLIGYLEILRYHKYRDAEEEEKYLSRAIENAELLKRLSDELFRSSIVEPDTAEPAAPSTDSVLFGNILSELCLDLKNAGFAIEPPEIHDRFTLPIAAMDLHRILNNILSNAGKYADPSRPVLLSMEILSGKMILTMTNTKGGGKEAESHGIGIPNIYRLVSKSGGDLAMSETMSTFTVHLSLPAAVDK